MALLAECRQVVDASLAEAKLAIVAMAGESLEARMATTEKLLLERSLAFDALIARLALHAFKDDGGNIAIAALGGYGRNELSLYSDLDLVIIHRKGIATNFESFLYPLWDSKVNMGHTTLELGDEASIIEDSKSVCAWLDARFLFGSKTLFEQAQQNIHEQLEHTTVHWAQTFKHELKVNRHEYGDSPFLLEPEIKLGMGGLRECNTLHWIGSLMFPAQHDLHNPKDTLVVHGLMLKREQTQLHHARSTLLSIRQWLHLHAGRKQDRLTFMDQEALASAWFKGDIEECTRCYYRATDKIRIISDQVWSRIDRHLFPPSSISKQTVHQHFIKLGQELTFTNSSDVVENPSLAIELFEKCLQEKCLPYPFALDAIGKIMDTAFIEALRLDAVAQQLFIKVLTAVDDDIFPHGIMQELANRGILWAIVPEFTPVIHRVQHDVYHLYTVDVHSIQCIQKIKALFRGDLMFEVPLATQVAAEISNRTTLFLGLFLHDIGKGQSRPHAEVGAEMADAICARFGFSDAMRTRVVKLVKEHLVLYHYAFRRDIDDPVTQEELSKVVSTKSFLQELYLLTLIDMWMTHPKSMNPWKIEMLDHLYNQMISFFEGTPETFSDHTHALETVEPDAKAFFLGLPERYFHAHQPHFMLEHAILLKAYRDENIAQVQIGVGEHGFPSLTILAADAPGLLSEITACFASLRIVILHAHIYTHCKIALDVFAVTLPQHVSQEDLKDKIECALREHRNKQQPRFNIASPNHRPKIPTEVRQHRRKTDGEPEWILEVFSQDRFGLLFVITDLIRKHGFDIRIAKISTEGERAIDVFYLHQAGGTTSVDDTEKTLKELADDLKSTLS